jgi:hypothetical protein
LRLDGLEDLESSDFLDMGQTPSEQLVSSEHLVSSEQQLNVTFAAEQVAPSGQVSVSQKDWDKSCGTSFLVVDIYCTLHKTLNLS